MLEMGLFEAVAGLLCSLGFLEHMDYQLNFQPSAAVSNTPRVPGANYTETSALCLGS